MKMLILIFIFLISQLNFGQKAFIHSYYDNCVFFKELTTKEISEYIFVKKNEKGLEIIIKIPERKKSNYFLNLSITTYNTEIQKYDIGHNANDWLELNKRDNTASILVNFHTKCAQKETNSALDSSGFFELVGGSQINKISGFFHANINGVEITGKFKNIKIN